MESRGRMHTVCHAFMAFFSMHRVILCLCLGIHYPKGYQDDTLPIHEKRLSGAGYHELSWYWDEAL